MDVDVLKLQASKQLKTFLWNVIAQYPSVFFTTSQRGCYPGSHGYLRLIPVCKKSTCPIIQLQRKAHIRSLINV